MKSVSNWTFGKADYDNSRNFDPDYDVRVDCYYKSVYVGFLHSDQGVERDENGNRRYDFYPAFETGVGNGWVDTGLAKAHPEIQKVEVHHVPPLQISGTLREMKKFLKGLEA